MTTQVRPVKAATIIGQIDQCLEIRCPWCGMPDYPEDNASEIVTCSTCGNEYGIEGRS